MIKKWAARVTASLALRRRRAALQRLPDLVLKDLGIGRSEIDQLTLMSMEGRDDPTRRIRS